MSATCANPLLLAWVKEMYDAAKERNTKGITTYKHAYDSIKACPLTFAHPSEAQQLHGIGPKICDALTERLNKHCEANGLPMPKKGKNRKRRSGDDFDEDAPEDEAPPAAKKPRKPKAYVPAFRSGAYALVLALSTISEDSREGLTKAELEVLAQPHCDSSLTAPSEAGGFYTAWNSIKTLTGKDLVYEKGRPRRYYLSEDGWEVAKRIKAVAEESNNMITDVAFAQERRDKQRAAKPKSNPIANGFLDLLEDSEGETALYQQPKQSMPRKRSPERPGANSAQPQPISGGQRLGVKPDDRFDIHSNPRERQPRSSSSVVDLMSSPEPEVAKHLPPFSSLSSQVKRPDAKEARLSVQPNKPSAPVPGVVSKSTTSHSNFVSSHTISTVPTFTPISLQPGTFTVELVVDTREVRAKEDRDYIRKELTKKGVTPIMRSLVLGDFFWVAKMKDPNLLIRYGEGTGDGSDELALDWIVERKRLDDLVGSITDGRFQEQRFRLKKSGVKNVIYVIEEYTLSDEKQTRFHEAIQTALASTQVVNGYFVKQTQKVDDTIRYLARMTRMLKGLYESKCLYLIPSKFLSSENHIPLLNHLRTDPAHRERNYYLTYPTFKDLSSKNGSLNLRDVFMKMLLCTRGVSAEKALALQKVFTTPRALIEALEACSTEKERDLLIANRLEGVAGRGKIKGTLSQKVARVWGEA